MATRKAPSRPSDVPGDVLRRLNSGTVESATLAEILAIDFAQLIGHVLPEAAGEAARCVDDAGGITQRMAAAARFLLEKLGEGGHESIAAHRSDTVRGWAAYMIGQTTGLTLEERLARMRPLADDRHFGVREWAWLAVRPQIAEQIRQAVRLLLSWVDDASANLRRFAVESTRPRGVWSAHITELKAHPEIAAPLLERVKSDPSKYVQDSVANWLNDAAKSQPDWVTSTCARWLRESDTKETARICARALRSVRT